MILAQLGQANHFYGSFLVLRSFLLALLCAAGTSHLIGKVAV